MQYYKTKLMLRALKSYLYSLYFVLRSGLKDAVYVPPVFTLSNAHSCYWNSTHDTTCQGCLSTEISHKQYRKFTDPYIISSNCEGDAKDNADSKMNSK